MQEPIHHFEDEIFRTASLTTLPRAVPRLAIRVLAICQFDAPLLYLDTTSTTNM